MRKWQNLCSPVPYEELTYVPDFGYGDPVIVSWEAITPKGMFFAGMHGTVVEIDTRWDEYSYLVILNKELAEDIEGAPTSVWLKESDLEFNWDEIIDEYPDPEPEPEPAPKRGRGRPRKVS